MGGIPNPTAILRLALFSSNRKLTPKVAICKCLAALMSVAVTTILITFAATNSHAQGFGTPQCGGVQQSVQLAIGNENPAVYKNHGQYVSSVSALIDQASRAGLIAGACGGCIVNQFALERCRLPTKLLAAPFRRPRNRALRTILMLIKFRLPQHWLSTP